MKSLETDAGTDKRYLNFVRGEWMPPSTNTFAPNLNPARRSEVIGVFPVSGKKDAEDAIAAAKEAFPGWSGTPGPSRGRILWRAAELLRTRHEELARMLCREEGKTFLEAKGEVS